MKYKKITLKRLYNNIASTRDYIWKKCIDANMGIEFVCNGSMMRLEPFELLQGQVEKTKHTSKFDSREYSLVNFAWKTNGNRN